MRLSCGHDTSVSRQPFVDHLPWLVLPPFQRVYHTVENCTVLVCARFVALANLVYFFYHFFQADAGVACML